MEEESSGGTFDLENKENGTPGLPPLAISGVVITKEQLIDALKVYIPNILDFSHLQDGQHFYILFGPDNQPS